MTALRGRRDDAGDLLVGRRMGGHDLADGRPVLAERGGQPRRDRIGRVGGRQGPRPRHDGEDRRAGLEAERQEPVAVPHERDRSLRDLARERLVGRAADDVEVGHLRCAEARAEGREPGVGGAEHVGVEQPAGRGMHDRRLDPRGLALVRDAQQQVVARLERRDRVDRLGVALGQGLHVQRVGDRDAPEPEPVTQEVVHHLAGERRGQVRGAGDRRERNVRGHDEVGPGLDCRHERHQLASRQPCLVEPEVRQAQVRVEVCLAEPGKVLDRRGGAGGPDAADHRRGERAHERRVVAERADAEVRVGGARGEVARRGVDDVDAHRERLRADRVPDPLGELDVAGRRERHVPRERRRGVAERDELPALLVRGDQQRGRVPALRRSRAAPRR